MKKLIVLAFVLFLIIFGSSACVVQTPPAPKPPTVITHVFGASIEAQISATPIEDGDGWRWHSKAGDGLEDWSDEIIAAYHAGPANVQIASLIYNDVLDGWDAHDQNVWSWVVAAKESDDRLIVELPWVLDVSLESELNEARAFVSSILQGRGQIKDWRPDLEAHPWLVIEDGLHLVAWGTEVTDSVQYRYDFLRNVNWGR